MTEYNERILWIIVLLVVVTVVAYIRSESGTYEDFSNDPIDLNLTIITVATDEEGYLPVLRKQLEDRDIPFEIIGLGEKWGGWKWRTDQIIDYLKNNHNKDDIVMIVDGYDILIPGTKQDIMTKYKKFKTDVVFGVEPCDSQNISKAIQKVYLSALKKFFGSGKYIKNGGSFMGRTESIIKIYERIKKYYDEQDTTDDQIALNGISLKGIDHKMDKKGEIFWIWGLATTYDIYHQLRYYYAPANDYGIEIKDKRPILMNDVTPEVVHGVANRDMSDLVDDDFEYPVHDPTLPNVYYASIVIKVVLMITVLLLIYLAYGYIGRDKENLTVDD